MNVENMKDMLKQAENLLSKIADNAEEIDWDIYNLIGNEDFDVGQTIADINNLIKKIEKVI